MNKNTLVYEFEKNSMEKVVVNLTSFKGNDYVDIRIWVMGNPAEPDSAQPTKKGICISCELLPELIKGLSMAQGSLEEEADAPQT